jgi:hypothetical protein
MREVGALLIAGGPGIASSVQLCLERSKDCSLNRANTSTDVPRKDAIRRCGTDGAGIGWNAFEKHVAYLLGGLLCSLVQ